MAEEIDTGSPHCPGCGASMVAVDGAWECTHCNGIFTPTGPIRLPMWGEASERD